MISLGRDARDSHLGDIVAALIDGELGVESRDRALAHAASCQRCREDVEAQRRLKATLRYTSRGADDLAESVLVASLLAIPRFPTAPHQSRRRLSNGRSGAAFSDVDHHPRGGARRRYVVGAGCAASVVIGFAGAAALGAGSPDNGQLVTPAVSTYAVENAATTGAVPLTDADLQAAITVAFHGR